MHLDLEKTNRDLCNEEPEQIIRWAKAHFGDGLVMTSSFGAESALLIHIATRVKPTIPIIVLDTGYLFSETHSYMNELRTKMKLDLRIFHPQVSPHDAERRYGNLWWQTHKRLYFTITKGEPLERAFKELRVKAFLSGVRADQTETRSKLPLIEINLQGIYKIHPLLRWNKERVKDYFTEHCLPYHPLVAEGWESIGDTHSTTKGIGREGRLLGEKKECGLHTGGRCS